MTCPDFSGAQLLNFYSASVASHSCTAMLNASFVKRARRFNIWRLSSHISRLPINVPNVQVS